MAADARGILRAVKTQSARSDEGAAGLLRSAEIRRDLAAQARRIGRHETAAYWDAEAERCEELAHLESAGADLGQAIAVHLQGFAR